MASIELGGRLVESPATHIALKEIGFGSDVVTFKIGEAIVSVSVLELIEINGATTTPVHSQMYRDREKITASRIR